MDSRMLVYSILNCLFIIAWGRACNPDRLQSQRSMPLYFHHPSLRARGGGRESAEVGGAGELQEFSCARCADGRRRCADGRRPCGSGERGGEGRGAGRRALRSDGEDVDGPGGRGPCGTGGSGDRSCFDEAEIVGLVGRGASCHVLGERGGDADGRRRCADGRRRCADGRRPCADGRRRCADGRRPCADQRRALLRRCAARRRRCDGAGCDGAGCDGASFDGANFEGDRGASFYSAGG